MESLTYYKRIYILLQHIKTLIDCVCIGVGLITKSCLPLCNPMDCSLPDFSVHGILQARMLKYVTISWTQVSCIAGEFFTDWATREGVYVLLTHKICLNTLQKHDMQNTSYWCHTARLSPIRIGVNCNKIIFTYNK